MALLPFGLLLGFGACQDGAASSRVDPRLVVQHFQRRHSSHVHRVTDAGVRAARAPAGVPTDGGAVLDKSKPGGGQAPGSTSRAARRTTPARPGRGARWKEQVTPTTPVYRLVPRGRQLWLVDPDGRRLLNLWPQLLVSYRPHSVRLRARDPHLRPRRLQVRTVELHQDPEGGWRARARARTRWTSHTIRLQGAPGDPRVRMSWEVTYHRDLLVGQELARLTVGPVIRGEMLDRAYRRRELGWRQFAGLLSPRRAQLVLDRPGAAPLPLTLLGGPGLQGLWVRHRRQRSYSVELELDHHRNHPFWRYRSCVKRSTRKVARRSLSLGLVRSGSTRQLRASWVVGPFQPLSVGRYPRGLAAAMVLVDHADQSSADRLEALAFGETGALKRGHLGAGHPGLVNRGLGYTKTVFVRRAGPYDRQLDDPHYRRVLQQMSARGVELGVHSPTGLRDRPAAARKLLDHFRRQYSGGTWVDHQPNTNCEAVGNMGWDARGQWYMLGHLAAVGMRYLWSGQDLPHAWGSLNLLRPEIPALRRPVIYPHSRLQSPGQPFVLFSTTWMFLHRRRLMRSLSPPWISRLVAERGLLLGHVYLESGRKHPHLHAVRSLLQRRPDGGYRLKPEVDRLFVRLQRRQQQGDLWVAGVESVAGHLLAAMDSELDYLPGGRVVVTNKTPLKGLTLHLPHGAASATVDGATARGVRRRQDTTEIWFDQLPARPTLLQLRDRRGHPLQLAHPLQIRVGSAVRSHQPRRHLRSH